MTEQEIKALQDDLAAARDRIAELEAMLDEANGHLDAARDDGKKWKARFEWLIEHACNGILCGAFDYCKECQEHGGIEDIDRIAAFADKEMGI